MVPYNCGYTLTSVYFVSSNIFSTASVSNKFPRSCFVVPLFITGFPYLREKYCCCFPLSKPQLLY